MDAKTLLVECIERERNYLLKQEVGSEKYNESLKRLNDLEGRLAELEKFEDERKDRKVKNILEGAKFVIGNVVVPVGMSMLVLKWEETGSLTTALRGWITGNIPKKPF